MMKYSKGLGITNRNLPAGRTPIQVQDHAKRLGALAVQLQGAPGFTSVPDTLRIY